MIAAVPAARTTTCRSSGSCCGPPAWRRSATSSNVGPPAPELLPRPGKLDELKAQLAAADANLVACDDELSPRQERNLESALGIPVIDRTAIILDIFAGHAHTRRRQAAGRAGPARVQPGADARPVVAPGTPRRRNRHPGPGRDPDRDRPPAGPRPDRRAQAPARPRPLDPVGDARRARARAPAADRAGRLHQRRQVDAAQRAHRRHVPRPRPAVSHARPDHAGAASRRPGLPADRHRRLHPQAPAPARRRLRRDARGDPPRRPDPARRRRLGARGGADAR